MKETKHLIIFATVLLLSCATGQRDNPFDAKGENWDRPVVTVMADASVDINDSLVVTATATDNGTVVRYLWARNGSAYADTTQDGSLMVAYSDSGQAVVLVIAVDNDGVESAPDTCIVTVTLEAPVMTAMADASVNINDSLVVTATATDNGTVVKYLWAKDGVAYADTTDSGSLRLAYSESGTKVVRAMAMDDDGVLSGADSCVVTVTLDAPVVTARSDSTVGFADTTSVTFAVAAVDTNAGGRIEKYYYDVGLDGWDDSTDAASYTVTTATGGAVAVAWAARDDDGVFSHDTFTILFNRPPASPGLTAPVSRQSWASFDWSTGKGTLPLSFSATDPDRPSDTLTYGLYTGPDAGSLTQAYYGTSTTHNLPDIDSSATVHYRLVVRDLFGDSAVSSGTFDVPPGLGVSDIDGNFYRAVNIGNQVWTIVNLRVGRYRDGSPIPHVTGAPEWAGLTTPGYCYYGNTSDTAMQEKYGALYNWYAVETGKLSPPGWHVPADSDWVELESYLIANGYNWDGTTSANKIGKSLAAKTDWRTSSEYTEMGDVGCDLASNNSTGFSALPGGYRFIGDGDCFEQGYEGNWWSSTEADTAQAYQRHLRYHDSDLSTYESHKRFGYSVRLVRD